MQLTQEQQVVVVLMNLPAQEQEACWSQLSPEQQHYWSELYRALPALPSGTLERCIRAVNEVRLAG